jgi:hypothetical protein
MQSPAHLRPVSDNWRLVAVRKIKFKFKRLHLGPIPAVRARQTSIPILAL